MKERLFWADNLDKIDFLARERRDSKKSLSQQTPFLVDDKQG